MSYSCQGSVVVEIADAALVSAGLDNDMEESAVMWGALTGSLAKCSGALLSTAQAVFGGRASTRFGRDAVR